MPYKKELENRREVLKGRFNWFFLHWPRDEKIFKKGREKIITQVRCEYPKFCYTSEEYYGSRALFFIQTSRWNMKFLSGILNSKLVEFWLRNKGKTQGTLLKLDKEPLLGIPLPNPATINKAQQQEIISLVDQILAVNSKQSTDDSKQKSDNSKQNCKLISDNCELFTDDCELEKQIDKKVYALYGLTEDEIKIVEK